VSVRPGSLLVWPHETASGARNMALDEAAMRPARTGDVILRVYEWRPACVSLGRNQPTAGILGGSPASGLVPGRDVVRRPTGGRSVYHGPEVTYAVTAPDRFLGGPREIYRAVHRAIGAALRTIGVPVDPTGPDAYGPRYARLPVDLDECFVAPAPGEITVGGRKLVGSAQWRNRGAVLQHGSILLRNEQHRATVSGEGGASAIGLEEAGVVATSPLIEALADSLVDAVADVTGRAPRREEPSAAVEEEAAAL